MTIRVKDSNGGWSPFECTPSEQTGSSCTLTVPALGGRWFICSDGMIANIGGNDWRIYTLHPDDCAALCALPTTP